MKNSRSFYCLLLFAIITNLMGCKKDISLDPNGQTTDKTNEAQLTNQLAGLYNVLQQDVMYGQGMWGYFSSPNDESFRTDAATGTVAIVLTESLRSSSEETTYLSLWRSLFAGVERANVILNVVNQPKMDENKRANVKGQALFLRAYYYYLLVNYFGDVPYKTIVTSEMGTSFDIPESPKRAIYDSIIKDMTAADTLVQKMSEAESPTIVTQSAVEAILARVCLSAAGYPNSNSPSEGLPYYQKALYWAEQLIKNGASAGTHGLNSTPHPQYPGTPAYARLFINNMQNNFYERNSVEGIWDAAFMSNGVGSYVSTGFPATQQLGVAMGIINPSSIARASGIYRPLPTLNNLYESGDQRKDWVFANYTFDINNEKLYGLGIKFNMTRPFSFKPRDTIYRNGQIFKINYDTIYYGKGNGIAASVNVVPIVNLNNGSVTGFNILDGGSGYLLPNPLLPAPYINVPAIASIIVPSLPPVANRINFTITIDPSTGALSAVTVNNPGQGYITVYDRPVAKWRREYETNITKSTTVTSSNFPIIRYADVLLMAAEADLQVNGGGTKATAQGIEYYNQVRRRAFGLNPLTPNASVDVSVVTLDNIKAERSRELCFEGVRRNDLKRWGLQNMINSMNNIKSTINTYNINFVPAATLTNSALAGPNNFLANPLKFVYFPIPSAELALSPQLSQNYGW